MNNNSAQLTHTHKNHAGAGPDAKPKRPLSSYNLFYRFKRQKILEAVALGGAAMENESIQRLVAAPPGLEDHPHCAPAVVSSGALDAFRRGNIRGTLERNTEARDTRKRLHRKSSQGAWNGSINFVELGKLMNASWRDCDAFAKSVLNELADEGRERYRRRIEEYSRQSRGANAQDQHKNAGEATPTSAHEKKMSAKEKMPVGTLTSSKAPPLPQSKSEAPREDSAMNETAKGMVQLAARAPPNNDSEMWSSFVQENKHIVGPSNLLDLLIKKDTPNASSPTPKESEHAMQNAVVPFAVPSSSQQNLPAVFPDAIEERLMLRVRERLALRVMELERQLEGKCAVTARVRAIEGEIMSQQWNTRNGLRGMMAQNGLGNAMTQDGAATMAPPAPPCNMFPRDGGPWRLFSASTVHPPAAYMAPPILPHRTHVRNDGPWGLFSPGTVHLSARAKMPSMWPSFTMSEIKSPEGFDGSPFKKRRIG